MSDLGALLKKAREQKGLSHDDIQDLTKIRKRYLEAIEEGNYKVLPGSFYVRAFVKNYAETVGLDSEEVLRLYNKEIPSVETESNAEPMMKPRRSSSRTSDRWSKWGFTLLMWSFLILIGVIIYTYVINQPDNGENREAGGGTNFSDSTDVPPPVTGEGDGGNEGTDTNGEENTNAGLPEEPVDEPEADSEPETV